MTEICVEIDCSLQQAKNIVKQNGFEFVESYTNFDTYFSTLPSTENESYPSLLKNSVVVRHIVGNNCNVKNIVYKSKTLDNQGNVIDEVKTKVNVDDIEKAKQVFLNLGLKCWCDYAVENHILKNNELEINIQYVKNLGTFIEIEEYPSIKTLEDVKKFEILKDIVKNLGFNIVGNDYSCKKPYMYLLKNEKSCVK